MKRFVLHITLFLPLALLFVVAMLWALGGTGWLRNVTYTLGHDDRLLTKVREVSAHRGADVLFVGSSHAYRTFDPRIFAERGIEVVNLGSSNQTPLQSEVLLRQYLDSVHPRLVVIEVHPDIMAYDGVESALYQLSAVPPSWHMVPMALRTHNLRVVCTMPYALLHNLVSDTADRFEESREGYVPVGYVERPVEHYSPQPHEPKAICVQDCQRRALRRCTNYLQRRGVPFIMIEVPDTRALMDSYTNLPRFQEDMSQYGPLYCSPLPVLDDSLHFYNEDHLNQCGVDLYCRMVRDRIIIPKLNSL